MAKVCEPMEYKPGARVALGMSGGVDSSTAVLLLQEAGFEVLGVTCIFIDDEKSAAAVADAAAVAQHLGIQHVVHACTELFEREVIRPFCATYAAGATPSPCVNCNQHCKIPALIAAADEYGCDYVATGHYAQVVRVGKRYAIACAADAHKDQSYMLSMLGQDQLARLMLPLGGIAGGKPEVRAIASAHGLPTASKSDSQDICFIEGSHLDFLAAHGVAGAPGAIVNTQGETVGRHEGLFRYTAGQRKGLQIGGAPEPYYVIGKRAEENELVVGFARDAALRAACVGAMNWQAVSPEHFDDVCAAQGSMPFEVKLRYRSQAAACQAVPACAGAAGVDEAACAGVCGEGATSTEGAAGAQIAGSFARQAAQDGMQVVAHMLETQPITAPGQFAVFYQHGVVACAGVIQETA